MQANEGREPTDEAEEAIEALRQRFARWWREVGSGIAPMALEEWSEHAERVARAAWVDGAFLSTTRPAPTADEVAQCDPPEHFCTYPDCRCHPDKLEGWCAKGLPTPISLWRQNTRLTARVAELEKLFNKLQPVYDAAKEYAQCCKDGSLGQVGAKNELLWIFHGYKLAQQHTAPRGEGGA